MKAFLLLFALILSTSGCGDLSDTVTNQYATLADARDDDLFNRGWLPDVLPPSARNIRTSNNLDINTSIGEFSFSSTETQQLYKLLKPGAPAQSKFADWQDTVTSYDKQGFSAWSYQKDEYTWAFFCNSKNDRCDYFLW